MKQHIDPSWSALYEAIRPYVMPPHPGRHRNINLAAGLGFLLGPLGVGLYFRSLFDFAAALLAAILLTTVSGIEPSTCGAIAGLLYGVFRVAHDKRGPDEPKPAPQPNEPLFEGLPSQA